MSSSSCIVCCYVLLQTVWIIRAETSLQDNRPSVLDGGCNPYVDMIFVLDKSTNVTDVDFDMQMNFINLLLKDHKAPQGAVRVAIMTCADNDTTYSPFTDDISPTSSLYLPPSTLYETDSSRHCLDNLNFMFKTKARDGVARQAVILRGSWDWNLEQVKVYAKTAKDENTVVVVIAIGIKKFDSLSALQLLATGDSTYFVLSKFQNLKDLAAVLAKDNCKPISLDLTSETRDQQSSTTTVSSVKRETCIQLTDIMYKRYIPGFGYTRLKCMAPRKLDLATCLCT